MEGYTKVQIQARIHGAKFYRDMWIVAEEWDAMSAGERDAFARQTILKDVATSWAVDNAPQY